MGLHPRKRRDFFDALVALGMLVRYRGLYANTPETDLFLGRGKSSISGGGLRWLTAGCTALFIEEISRFGVYRLDHALTLHG